MSPVRRRPLALAALALLAAPVLAACQPAAAPRALPPATSSPAAAAPVSAQQVSPPVTARPRPSAAARRPAAKPAAARVRTALPRRPAAPVRPAAPRPAATAAPRPATTVAPRPPARTAPAPRPAAGGDAYPWRDSAGTANDPWGFTERQCVSYAAWRLSQAGHAISNSQGWGSALDWDDTARRLGRTVSSAPRVGAIAQWNAGESSQVWVNGSPGGTFAAGSYGHVAYVTAVYGDGSVQVSQYNATGSRSYSSMRMRAPRYLYL